jgi:hypothetical protein
MPGPAMQLQTMQVYWAKFGAEPVTINAAAFDAAVHRRLEDGPAPTASVPVVTRRSPRSPMTVRRAGELHRPGTAQAWQGAGISRGDVLRRDRRLGRHRGLSAG